MSLSEYYRIFYLLDKSAQCPDKDSTNNFSIDFSSPCFDVPKKCSFTSGGVGKGRLEMIVKSLQDILFHGKQETTGKFACRETEYPQMTSPVCSCAVLYPTGTELHVFSSSKQGKEK